jgi:hypothetical protein
MVFKRGKPPIYKLLHLDLHIVEFAVYLPSQNGGLAQLARALAWHARGHRFDSDILHYIKALYYRAFFIFSKANSLKC